MLLRMPQQLVTIWHFRDLPAAQIALSKLESAGITCELADDEMVRMDWFYSNLIGGIRLQVAEDEVEEALTLLREPVADHFTAEEIGEEFSQPQCPNCGSLDVTHVNRPRAVTYLALAALSLPIMSGIDEMKCETCGNTWDHSPDTTPEEPMTDTILYAASSNKGKLREFKAAASEYNIFIEPLPDLDQIDPPEENGDTFEQNAAVKAAEYSKSLPGRLVFADDSGLEVDALNGAPGVRSARYAATEDDPDPSDDDNNYKLIYELSLLPNAPRTAQFVCVIALAKDGEVLRTFKGVTEGEILSAPLGKGGFGYDPLFILPGINKTFAELNAQQKLELSHRGKAFRAMLQWLAEKDVVSLS
jgi:XTP/dITP diphosphohydrolase